jgi:hypothetical protein
MRWNPFFRLIESKKYPYSRLIKSTWKQRIRDTFYVFNGEFIHFDFGLLDYPFFLNRFLLLAVISLDHRFDRKAALPIVVLLIPLVILTVTKAFVAFVLTFVVSPIVFIVHLIIQPFWNQMVNQIKNVIVRPVDKNKSINEDNPEFEKDQKLLELENFNFKENVVRPITRIPGLHTNTFFQTYWPNDSIIYLGFYRNQNWRYFNVDDKPSHSDMHDEELCGVIEINTRNWRGILAMLNSNSFGIAENIENSCLTNTDDMQEEIEKQIIPRLAKKAFIDGFSKALRNQSPLKQFVTAPHFDPEVVGLIFEFAGFPKGYRNMEASAYIADRRIRMLS